MKKMSIYSVFNIILAAVIFAPFTQANDKGKEPSAPDHTRPISWDEFKESCLYPERFHNQVPPSNIKVQCTDIRKEYIPVYPGTLPTELTEGSRKVIYAVFSNKYHVNADSHHAPLPPTGKLANVGASCLRYKEVERTLTVERSLTCNDIVNIKFDLAEYCTSILDGSKGNAKLTDSRDTGNYIDTCTGATVTPVPFPTPSPTSCPKPGKGAF